jgi:hypothetical protein
VLKNRNSRGGAQLRPLPRWRPPLGWRLVALVPNRVGQFPKSAHIAASTLNLALASPAPQHIQGNPREAQTTHRRHVLFGQIQLGPSLKPLPISRPDHRICSRTPPPPRQPQEPNHGGSGCRRRQRRAPAHRKKDMIHDGAAGAGGSSLTCAGSHPLACAQAMMVAAAVHVHRSQRGATST